MRLFEMGSFITYCCPEEYASFGFYTFISTTELCSTLRLAFPSSRSRCLETALGVTAFLKVSLCYWERWRSNHPCDFLWTGRIDVNDGRRLVIQYTQSGEAITFVSFFEYVWLFSDRPDTRRLVLGMRVCSVDFYLCDGHALRSAAAGARASCCMHWGGRGMVWCRCCSDQIDTPFICVEEGVGYQYRLSAMLGRFRRQICSGDLLQSSMRPFVQLCCLDRPYHIMWCFRRLSF